MNAPKPSWQSGNALELLCSTRCHQFPQQYWGRVHVRARPNQNCTTAFSQHQHLSSLEIKQCRDTVQASASHHSRATMRAWTYNLRGTKVTRCPRLRCGGEDRRTPWPRSSLPFGPVLTDRTLRKLMEYSLRPSGRLPYAVAATLRNTLRPSLMQLARDEVLHSDVHRNFVCLVSNESMSVSYHDLASCGPGMRWYQLTAVQSGRNSSSCCTTKQTKFSSSSKIRMKSPYRPPVPGLTMATRANTCYVAGSSKIRSLKRRITDAAVASCAVWPSSKGRVNGIICPQEV